MRNSISNLTTILEKAKCYLLKPYAGLYKIVKEWKNKIKISIIGAKNLIYKQLNQHFFHIIKRKPKFILKQAMVLDPKASILNKATIMGWIIAKVLDQ